MNTPSLQQAYSALLNWCRERDFAGYDPFDALNSRLFQLTPLKHSRLMRLAWTQINKRSPINLRPLLLVPRARNAKGIALFALAVLAQHRSEPTAETESIARTLLTDLLRMQIGGLSGMAWGYNFDWQSRVLFAPTGTPTIVPTAFACRALVEAHEAFGDENYLDAAESVCQFIVNDLVRTVETEAEVCFSYSPTSHTRVYNASLLAAEALATVSRKTGKQELGALSLRAARYIANRQNEDGSWSYGADPSQKWTDSFHTAFVLSSLSRMMQQNDKTEQEFMPSLRRGYEFWRSRFFLADGSPKYYDDALFPLDTHAAGSAIATLADLSSAFDGALGLAEKIANWSFNNLRHPSGYFYYQRRRFYTVRTPFMRWAQAWMLYGLARLSEEQAKVQSPKSKVR